MRSPWIVAAALVVATMAPAAGATIEAEGLTAADSGPDVQQIGTYDYLNLPDYDGLAPVRRIGGESRIGLGTFDHIDGEMVVLGGVFYRVGTDGTPRVVSVNRRSPFAQTIAFRPQLRRQVPSGTACADLTSLVDRWLGSADGIVALRLRGRFRSLQMRSVPRQSKPYPTLADVVAEETVFDLDGRRATLVGFRTGADLTGVSPVGTHLHGLTRNRGAGGHTLSCVAGRHVTAWVQRAAGVRIVSPQVGPALG